MELRKKDNRILEWSLIPVIFTLAWPTMLEQFLNIAVQYIDTAMVGVLGTEATAAVGATTTIGWLVGSTTYAFGVGFLAYISQAFGAGDKERARRASAQSVLVTFLLGILLTAITLSLSPFIPKWMNVDPEIREKAQRYFFILYTPMLFRSASIIFATVLRASGDTRTPMRVGLSVNIINVGLNYLLIYPTRTVNLFGVSFFMPGAGFGVEGAAVASAISFALGGIWMTIALWKHKDISPKGMSLRPDVTVLRPCIRVSIPNMLQRFCSSLGYVVFAMIINSLGEISTAAHTIGNTVESVFYIPGYGMMHAAATLTGNAIGACDKKRLSSMTRMINFVEFLMMTVTGTLLFVFAEPLVCMFSSDPRVISLCTFVLKMIAFSEPFYGISIVIEGMMMGAGETLRPFYFNISCMWGVRIVGSFICIMLLGFGLVSAWVCMISGNMILMLLYVLYYRYGKWNPMST